MVVAFSNPAGRNRLPLFRERAFVTELLESETAVKDNDVILAKLSLGEVPPDFPAVSIEPENYVDFRKQFYLLPILEATEIYFLDGFSVRLLQIASVPAEPGVAGAEAGAPAAGGSGRRPRTGIAFVVDATTSMGPYIERTRQAIRGMYRAIKAADLQDRVSFALVGYRDNIDKRPELGFVSKVFADFDEGANAETFFEEVKGLKAASVSSLDFVEDAYAGILTAIERLDWDGFAARYIVLITDAGARESYDLLGQTGMNALGLRQLAADEGIAIYSLHLLTPEGRRNHERARAQLGTLSSGPQGSTYYAVTDGRPDRFGFVVDEISDQIKEQVELHADPEARQQDYLAAAGASPEDDAELARLRQTTARIGYAMRLAYLGRAAGTRAPSVFRAWIADRDVSHPDRPALEVRVLLTKNQLSDLQEALRAILEAGEKGQLSPETFFQEVMSAAAVLSRTPDRVGRGAFKNLAESGLLGEFLEDLPYQSKVMSVSEDLWLSWSIGEQQAFLDELDAKIRLYEAYHDDVDRWIALSEGARAGETVYPVPLDSLP
jgi:hypothetical protein